MRVTRLAFGPKRRRAVDVVYSFSTEAGIRGVPGEAENSDRPVVRSTT
jgi:hypothetical protein